MLSPEVVERLKLLSGDPTLVRLVDRGCFDSPYGSQEPLKFHEPFTLDSAQTRLIDRLAGCLVGGVIGNAMGNATRRLSSEAARETLEKALSASVEAKLQVSSDAQFLLATAEGLLRGLSRFRERGIGSSPAEVVRMNYERLLLGQGFSCRTFGDPGWLLSLPAMQRPGDRRRTTYAALLQRRPIESAGSGAIVRSAAAGLMGLNSYELGCDIARITHLDPEAVLPSGILSLLVERFVTQDSLGSLEAFVRESLEQLDPEPGNEACRNLCMLALKPLEHDDSLGGGWKGTEALARAIHFCVTTTNFRQAVTAAACFEGDHDTVGCVTGCLAGTIYGHDALPDDLIQRVELVDAARQLAADVVLYAWCGAFDTRRYPPN